MFNKLQINKLFLHRFCDHKIKLTSDFISSQSKVYRMFSFKLQKIKKYLNENLLKNFITFNKTLYFSSVLFALKINKNLRFCVDYRKLNVMIKRNRYFLSLIEEMIEKIISCKHLTRLNIIVVFNKLRMHFKNENMITFITTLKSYKYKILFFDLINDFSTFQ